MSVTFTDYGTHSSGTGVGDGESPIDPTTLVITKLTTTEMQLALAGGSVPYTLSYQGTFEINAQTSAAKTLADLEKIGTVGLISNFSVSVGAENYINQRYSPAISIADFSDFIDTKASGLTKVLAGDDIYITSSTATGDKNVDVYLYSGNDVFYQNHAVLKSDDIFYGGDGVDTAVISAASSRFKVISSNYVWDHLKQVSNLSGFYVTDETGKVNTTQLNQVEQIQFADTTLQTKWFSEAQTLGQSNPSQFTTLTGMYIAYFNRAPDAVGLDYWASNIYEGATASQVARNFSASPEAMATFGSVSATSSTTELTNFVNGVYQNVLNRASDVSGLVYWVSELKAGSVAPGDFILAILNAVNSQTGTADKTYVTSKTSVGAHFAVADGLTNTTQAKAVMAAFNSTYATSGAAAAITAANKVADGYLANVATTPELIVQLVGVNV